MKPFPAIKPSELNYQVDKESGFTYLEIKDSHQILRFQLYPHSPHWHWDKIEEFSELEIKVMVNLEPVEKPFSTWYLALKQEIIHWEALDELERLFEIQPDVREVISPSWIYGMYLLHFSPEDTAENLNDVCSFILENEDE
ncbi:MAG: hypothetical protein AB4058_11380 [Microcystaceae cyanobacterium]